MLLELKLDMLISLGGGSLLAVVVSLSFITSLILTVISCWGSWTTARALDNQALNNYRSNASGHHIIVVD